MESLNLELLLDLIEKADNEDQNTRQNVEIFINTLKSMVNNGKNNDVIKIYERSRHYFEKEELKNFNVEFLKIMIKVTAEEQDYLLAGEHSWNLHKCLGQSNNLNDDVIVRDGLLYTLLSPREEKQELLLEKYSTISTSSVIQQFVFLLDIIKMFKEPRFIYWPTFCELYRTPLQKIEFFSAETKEGKEHFDALEESVIEHDLWVSRTEERTKNIDLEISSKVICCLFKNMTYPIKRFAIKLGILNADVNDFFSLLETIIACFRRPKVKGFSDDFRKSTLFWLDVIDASRYNSCLGRRYWPIHIEACALLLTVWNEHEAAKVVKDEYDSMKETYGFPYDDYPSSQDLFDNKMDAQKKTMYLNIFQKE